MDVPPPPPPTQHEQEANANDAWFAAFMMEQMEKANDITAKLLYKHPEWLGKA